MKPQRSAAHAALGFPSLCIADVGQNQREEIDFIAAASAGGQSFGWRQREGNIDTPGIGDPPTPGLTGPLLDYNHSFGASVTGGYLVRDAGSALNGRYVFGDFISDGIADADADGRGAALGAPVVVALRLRRGP